MTTTAAVATMLLRRGGACSAASIGRLSATAGRSSFHTTAAAAAIGGSVVGSRPNLSKVLVANRGEIACRVLRTCRRLGVPTVAVYSDADGPDCLHARMADESYKIGHGPSPSESYLLQDEILDVCYRTGADAVHPGYGFLSENVGFARKLESSDNIRFVGPPASAIAAMGSKSESKSIMDAAGVPTTPGYHGNEESSQDAEFLKAKAVEEVGFPCLIKAVMGGGGKGMRLVWDESEFDAALRSAQNEARSSFGDDSVLLEKYLVKPRHVEVQIVADSHGNVVHLYERDCSLQRRHQKIIEEAPASDLDPETRQRLGEMGKRAAQAVGYVSAGTVEFLLDTQDDPTQFYFCEMNTRLQVEHPITEQITGIDLVEWQLRIAAGEELPVVSQTDIACVGHAFEARVYAENPARNFLPAAGRVWHHQPPSTINTGVCPETGIRVDTGLQSGQDVGVYYDPMVSKLVAYGENRTVALHKLIDALKRYQIAGVPTNLDFLVKCAKHPVFGQAGEVNTGFLEDYADDVQIFENELPEPMAQAVGSLAAMLMLENRIGSGTSPTRNHPWSSLWGSWRMGGESGRATRDLVLADSGESIECICNRDGSFDVRTVTRSSDKTGPDEREVIHVAGKISSNGQMEVVVNGTRRIRLTTVLKEIDGVIQVRMWPDDAFEDDYFWKLDVLHPLQPALSIGSALLGKSQGLVKSPMPGKINRVLFGVGDSVKEGDVVVVMEAMKMEHSIKAPCNGVVIESAFKPGDIVNDGAVLFLVDGGEEAEESIAQ